MPTSDPAGRIKTALRALQQAEEPLDRLDLGRRIREAADELEADAIREARENGATWRDIGACYGLTKQGAQQRFRTSEPEVGNKAPGKKAARPAGTGKRTRNHLPQAGGGS